MQGSARRHTATRRRAACGAGRPSPGLADRDQQAPVPLRQLQPVAHTTPLPSHGRQTRIVITVAPQSVMPSPLFSSQAEGAGSPTEGRTNKQTARGLTGHAVPNRAKGCAHRATADATGHATPAGRHRSGAKTRRAAGDAGSAALVQQVRALRQETVGTGDNRPSCRTPLSPPAAVTP